MIDPSDVAASGPSNVLLELVCAASLPSVLDALATTARVVVFGIGIA